LLYRFIDEKENMPNYVISLIKFVGERKFAEDFLNGNLYCNPWKFFKALEGDKQREDKQELIVAIVSTKIYNRKTNTLYSLGIENSDDYLVPVFCMYSVFSKKYILPNKLRIQDESLRGFGKHGVVIKNVREFLNRLNTQLPEFSYGLIKYLDFSNLTGKNRYALTNPIIQKDKKDFSHQQEFRIYNKHIALTNNPKDINPSKKMIRPDERGAQHFSIGDLSDIAEIHSMDELFNGIDIQYSSSVHNKNLSKELWWNGKKYENIS
jgi:hypothetical protein